MVPMGFYLFCHRFCEIHGCKEVLSGATAGQVQGTQWSHSILRNTLKMNPSHVTQTQTLERVSCPPKQSSFTSSLLNFIDIEISNSEMTERYLNNPLLPPNFQDAILSTPCCTQPSLSLHFNLKNWRPLKFTKKPSGTHQEEGKELHSQFIDNQR